LGAHSPSRSTSWRGHIVEGLRRRIDRLLTDPEDFTDAAADRISPLEGVSQFAVMIGELTQISTLLHVVVDEGLQQQLTDIRAIGGSGYRKQLTDKRPDHPWFRHRQGHGSRA
jgi:hypothetical protein